MPQGSLYKMGALRIAVVYGSENRHLSSVSDRDIVVVRLCYRAKS